MCRRAYCEELLRNPLRPLHELLFPIINKGSFICTFLASSYHGLYYTSRGALAGMRIAQLIQRPLARRGNALPSSYTSHLAYNIVRRCDKLRLTKPGLAEL